MNTTSNRARSEYSWHQFRDLLARSGLTRDELAQQLGRSRNWVSGRTTGRFPISDEDAIAIVQALGVGLRDLMEPPPYRVVEKLANVLYEVQVQIVDDPFSTDEEVQWFLRFIREVKDQILSNPNRASREPRARKL